ncbi:MAG: ABC transporter substrate-binding protein [Actinobacteria bacterium]|nr:MAG: ABC transporter substrate-binding protein [Actinomycetota bacterium]
MKRYIVPLVLLAALVAVGTAGAVGISPVKGSFKYCDNPTFPPMESKTTSGKTVGFDIDMANAIGKLWRVKAKFVFSSFDGLLPALGAKRCNMVISGIFITPDRTAKFPAVPYMKSHRALVVASGNPKGIKSPNDLSGRNVAVQTGTKYEQYLKDLNDQFKSAGKSQMNLSSYPGDTDAIGQILIGRADAVLTQDTEGAYQKKQHPGKLGIGYLFPETDTFGIYYRPSDKKLGTALRAAIKTLKKNGTMKKLAAKQQIPAGDVK